jgi:divalent metal cation (Fe/Co/Zn/Cd) transporter
MSAVYAMSMAETAVITRAAIARRGRRLEYFTIAWNMLEGLVAVVAGALAGSISLLGFGIDSFIEVTSGAALLWRMAVDADSQNRERNERRSLRTVGLCFLGLAVYVAYEAGADLWRRQIPEHSITGIVLACVSLSVMPLLSLAKRKVGRALGSAAMQADAKQTEFCAPLGHFTWRLGAKRVFRIVVGRSCCRRDYGPDYGERGNRGPTGQRVL